jgi:lysophospholipase L1-like esterase
VEAASYAFFTLARDRFATVLPEQYVLKREALPGLLHGYDAELGWTQHYATPYGERPRPRTFGRALGLALGDSFTHGDEVEHAETWPQALAETAQADVYNLGVGGYGADQSLLQLRRLPKDVPGPVLLFGFELRNVDRVVNVYRPFLLPTTGIPLPKPRFALQGGALRLLPNPAPDKAALERLLDPAFVARIGADDYWYSSARNPRFSFPYTRLLFDTSVWRQALGSRDLRGEVAARPEEDLWRVAEPRALYLALLDAIVAEAAARGYRPVLVLLPSFHAFHHLRRNQPVAGRTAVLQHCAAKGYACFDALGLLVDDPARRKADVLFRPGGHTSAEANRAIGAALAASLQRR